MLKKNPQLFFELAKEILLSGNEFRFKATGSSMQPFILDGDVITIRPLEEKKLKRGEVAFYYNEVNQLFVHRVHRIYNESKNTNYIIKGDGLQYNIEYVDHNRVLGIAVKAERGNEQIVLNSLKNRYYPLIYLKSNIYKIKFFNIIKKLFKKLKKI